MRYLFSGGILDGREMEVEDFLQELRVPVRDEKWSELPESQVLDETFHVQLYVKDGDIFRLS